jgi:helix-turn-helix protein
MKTTPTPGAGGFNNHDDVLLDNHDLIQLFPVSRSTIRNWRNKGILPHYKIAGKILYKKSEVMIMLDERKR